MARRPRNSAAICSGRGAKHGRGLAACRCAWGAGRWHWPDRERPSDISLCSTLTRPPAGRLPRSTGLAGMPARRPCPARPSRCLSLLPRRTGWIAPPVPNHGLFAPTVAGISGLCAETCRLLPSALPPLVRHPHRRGWSTSVLITRSLLPILCTARRTRH
jgi:hypothetical protein